MAQQHNWIQLEQFPRYEVSDLGEIRNVRSRKWLVHNSKAHTVSLRGDDLSSTGRRLHRVIADVFNIPGQGRYIAYRDGNDRNIAAKNMYRTDEAGLDGPNKSSAQVLVTAEDKLFNKYRGCGIV